MRKSILATTIALSGCGVLPPNVPPALEGHCNAQAAQGYVGQPPSQETGQGIMKASGATTLRWAAPGTMMTMEFNPGRVTARYTAEYRISAITCG